MTVRFLTGDARFVLSLLPADSVHCVVTSPPYWSLRDFGIAPSVWGGDAACEHEFACESVSTEVGRGNWAQGVNGRGEVQPGGVDAKREPIRAVASRGFCRCNAWRGAHGLEPDIALYVRNAVEIFRAVHRVLRPDGVLWLNLGDSYAQGVGMARGQPYTRHSPVKSGLWAGTPKAKRDIGNEGQLLSSPGLKPKDLCGIPWRVAFALQADGWFLRQDIIWHKPNPMPESVTDRCTKAHEYLFLLTKSARYFFDAEAIKESVNGGAHEGRKDGLIMPARGGVDTGGAAPSMPRGLVDSRNKRSVWTVATSPFPEAHFATFPPKLIEPCIKAGTSEKGCCAKCGAPWERQTKQVGGKSGKSWHDHEDDLARGQRGGASGYHGTDRKEYESYGKETLGWRPTCNCAAAVVPATVLDPFAGAGTTGLVADRLQRNAILIELNPDYVEMAVKRICGEAPLLAAE